MPRENIFPSAAPSPDSPKLGVAVCWGRGQSVELASFELRPDPNTPYRLRSVEDAGPEGDGSSPGWFVGMDRDSINRVIRALRRARDQAYGRDE